MDGPRGRGGLVGRHPAAGPAYTPPDGYGMRVVEIRGAATVPVYGERERRSSEMVIGYVDLPPVHVLECSRCGSLHRIGSPFALTHTLRHRWESWGRRTRAAVHAVTSIGRGHREVG